MKYLVLACLLSLHHVGFAQKSESHDFGRSTNEVQELSAQDLSYRMYIRGEILIFNQEGNRILDFGNEFRTWEFNGLLNQPLVSYWSFEQKGLPVIGLKHEWKILPSGQLEMKIQHYDKLSKDSKGEIQLGRLLKSDSQTVQLFRSYDLELAASGNRKVVVRLTPALWPKQDTVEASDFPISTKDVVLYDGEGNVWASGIEGDRPSKYLGISTHKGTILLSYNAFKGAEEVGSVKGGQMKLKFGKQKLFLLSPFGFVPRDVRVKVYGRFIPNMKTERLNSIRTFSSNKEPEFLAGFK